MDALEPQDVRRDAYGQAVWSCPLDAGVKLCRAICAATVTKKPDTPGRARSSRKAIAQGVPDVSALPDDLWAFFFSAHKACGCG